MDGGYNGQGNKFLKSVVQTRPQFDVRDETCNKDKYRTSRD